MRSIKRELLGFPALCAMALAFALVVGSPFIAAGPAFAQDQPQPSQQPNQAQPPQQPNQAVPPQTQPDQSQAKSATFTGTVVKYGSDYMLKDSSGSTFKLDDAQRAKPFEGKTVKVTGQLDEQAKVIHVESIEAAEA